MFAGSPGEASNRSGSLAAGRALAALAIAALPVLWATGAQAQAARTWVSGVGDDVNPCSRTAPCKTFAGAISKTAANGEINCLDPGGFGAVTITKSITIDCQETFGSILYSGTNGININYDSFGADVRKTVNLRGLMLQGADLGLVGIRIFGAASANSAVSIEHCVINGNFGGTARGISDERTGGGELYVSNTTVRNMAQTGIAIVPASGSTTIKAVVDNVRVQNANFGVAAGNGSRVMVNRSVFSGNTQAGIEADAGAEVNVDNSVSSHNGVGVQSAGGIIRLSNTNVAFNTAGVSGTINTFTNNRFSSNGPGGTITPLTPAGTNPSAQQ
jgi:hypothetical protein